MIEVTEINNNERRLVPDVDSILDGACIIKPFPPIPPPSERTRKCKRNAILLISFKLTVAIGIIIGFKWGGSATRQQQGGGSSSNDRYNNKENEAIFGKKWIPYGQRLLSTDGASEFGESIDLNGDATVLATGAYSHNDLTGIVRVMKYLVTSGWTQMGNSINGRFERERFGASVQLSRDGETLIAGGMGSTSANGNVYGHVKGYRYDSYTDKWVQIGNPVQGDYRGDHFGISLSVASNGKSWIVGADNKCNDSVQQKRDGYAKVYELFDGVWKQKGRTIVGENGSCTAYAVAMSGDGQTICVGDRKYEVNENLKPGRARCFKWSDGDWHALGGNLLGDFHQEQNGHSLALNEDGTVVAVGAARYESGSVRVYSLENNGVWGVWKIMGEKLTGEDVQDQMGFKVALNRKGDVLAYTGRGHDTGLTEGTGVVRVKRWVNGAGWISLGDDIPGYEGGDHFGESLALDDDGTTLVSSANYPYAVEYANAFMLV